MPDQTHHDLTPHVRGWLLALPAVVLLAAFTHVPAVSTIIESFYATPHGARPAPFIGLAQYRAMLDDPDLLARDRTTICSMR